MKAEFYNCFIIHKKNIQSKLLTSQLLADFPQNFFLFFGTFFDISFFFFSCRYFTKSRYPSIAPPPECPRELASRLEKLADISRRPALIPLGEMTFGKRPQKFHTDAASLPRSRQCFKLVEENFPRGTTNQKHYPDLGSDTSSV